MLNINRLIRNKLTKGNTARKRNNGIRFIAESWLCTVTPCSTRMLCRRSFINMALLVSIAFSGIHCTAGRKVRTAPSRYKPPFMYKQWFFTPPAGTATGFPSTLGAPEHDALIRLLAQVKLHIKGFKREYYEHSHVESQDSVFFYYDTSALKRQKERVVIVDTMKMGRRYAVLAANTNMDIDESQIPVYQHTPSGWDKKLHCTSDSLIYAAGAAAFSYYNPANAWVQAEENAIKQLGEKSSVYFASLQQYNEHKYKTTLSETYKLVFDLFIRHVQVEERYYDPENKKFHVLVSCNKNHITP